MPVWTGIAGAVFNRQFEVGVVVLSWCQGAFVALVTFDSEPCGDLQHGVVNFRIHLRAVVHFGDDGNRLSRRNCVYCVMFARHRRLRAFGSCNGREHGNVCRKVGRAFALLLFLVQDVENLSFFRADICLLNAIHQLVERVQSLK